MDVLEISFLNTKYFLHLLTGYSHVICYKLYHIYLSRYLYRTFVQHACTFTYCDLYSTLVLHVELN